MLGFEPACDFTDLIDKDKAATDVGCKMKRASEYEEETCGRASVTFRTLSIWGEHGETTLTDTGGQNKLIHSQGLLTCTLSGVTIIKTSAGVAQR